MKFPRKQFEKFCSHLVLNSKEKGRVPFKWNGAQVRFMDELEKGLENDQHKHVCCKARQLGITTMTLAIDLFQCYRNPGTQGALAVSTESVRDLSRNILTNYMDSLPNGMKVPVKVSNRSEIRFANASRISHMIAGGRNSGALARGEGLNYCHATEMSSWADPEGVISLDASLAETYADRLYLFESTARGFNVFHDMWEDAEKSLSTNAIFIGWWAKEDYRMPQSSRLWSTYGRGRPSREEQAWAREVAKRYGHDMTPEQFAWWRWKWAESGESRLLVAEYPWTADQAFVMTGDQFFGAQTLKKMRDAALAKDRACWRYVIGPRFEDTRLEPDPDGPLSIFEEPKQDAEYVIAADPAYGESEWADHFCLSEDTEILTSEGWLKYGSIRKGMLASCFDLETGEYSFQPISHVIVKDHDGDMVHFTSRSVDCLATPEHRMVVSIPQNGKGRRHWYPWSFRRADNVPRQFKIPLAGAPCGPGIEGLSLPMCRMLGWLASDGYRISPKRSGHGAYTLGQSLGTTKRGVNIASEMEAVLFHEFGIRPRKQPGKGTKKDAFYWYLPSCVAAKINTWLGTDGVHRIDRKILNGASKEQLEALFLGLMEGDGTSRHGEWVRFYPGYNDGLANDLQEVAIRLGYSASKTQQRCNGQVIVDIARRASHYMRKRSTEAYKGTVWCVTVPTGAFVARRNGKVFVTGNCAQVLRCERDRVVQVAEFNSPDCTMYGFAWILAHLAGAYSSIAKPATLIIELGGPGRGVLQELQRMPEQYADRIESLSPNAQRALQNLFGSIRHYLYRRPDSLSGGRLLQWETTWKTKQIMMNLLRDCLERGMVEVNSPEWPEEARFVTQNGSRIQAEGQHKDDRVVALALGVVAWQQQVLPELLAAHAEAGYGHGPATPLDRAVHNWLDGVRQGADDALWSDQPASSLGSWD